MSSTDKMGYNDYKRSENISMDVAKKGDITFYINGAGIETEDERYLNKGSLGKGFNLRCSANMAIVRIGDKTFRDPIPVSTAGFTWQQIADFNEIVLRTLVDATHFDLLVL